MPYKDPEKNKACIKKYYQDNKVEILRKEKIKNDLNKEAISIKNEKYRNSHKEEIIEYKKEYYIKNKESIALDRSNRYIKDKESGKIAEDEIKHKVKRNIRRNLYNIKNRIKKSAYNKEYHKCRGCGLFQTNKITNFLCSYCNPVKALLQKTQEIKLKNFLDKQNYEYTYNKRCTINSSCQLYFPDFVFDKGTFFIVLECDEDGHKRHSEECEKIRENNIVFSLGLPCIFLKYNPDKKHIKDKVKQIILKSYIDYYMSKEFCDNEVVYLFY